MPKTTLQKTIPTPVKDDDLVRRKRAELVAAAVPLFIRKGYHATTTRELAREAGWSTGALYEYVKRKEDVLYLVCDAIHGEMEAALRADLSGTGDHGARLEHAIAAYVRTCDRMQDSILLIYRETASLPEEARRCVLENEMRITKLFEGLLREGAKAGVFRFKDARARGLMAHNITVIGHMWAFRRWALGKQFTLKHYIRQQTSLLIREIMAG